MGGVAYSGPWCFSGSLVREIQRRRIPFSPHSSASAFGRNPGAMATGNSMAAAGGQAARNFLTSKQKRERGQKWKAPILADSGSLSAPVSLLGLFCHTKSVACPDQRIRIVGSYYFLMGVCARRRPSPAPVCSAGSLPILNFI